MRAWLRTGSRVQQCCWGASNGLRRAIYPNHAKNPNGPYIRRDGFTNPANFDDHRKAMVRLSLIVPALAAAWELTGDKKYADQAGKHLRAWFVDPATKMNTNLEYAQAIFNLNKGRGTGIIDTLHPL